MNVTDRMMLNKWLVASATKFAHPDKQVRVVISRPAEQEILEVLLSLPEAEAAIRQLMQAYANAMGKSLQLCAYPVSTGEQRTPPLISSYTLECQPIVARGVDETPSVLGEALEHKDFDEWSASLSKGYWPTLGEVWAAARTAKVSPGQFRRTCLEATHLQGRPTIRDALEVRTSYRNEGSEVKRKSIREHIEKVCAPHTTLARSGFARDMRFQLQRAYRIGVNNGKLIAAKKHPTPGE